jgi:hypothetical protein
MFRRSDPSSTRQARGALFASLSVLAVALFVLAVSPVAEAKTSIGSYVRYTEYTRSAVDPVTFLQYTLLKSMWFRDVDNASLGGTTVDVATIIKDKTLVTRSTKVPRTTTTVARTTTTAAAPVTTVAPTTTTTLAPTTTTLAPTTTTTLAPTTTTTLAPTTTTTTPVPFNLLTALAAGGTVNVPAGTYTISSPVSLQSGTHVVGVPGQTVFRMGAKSETTQILNLSGVSDVSIQGVTFACDAIGDNIIGIKVDGCTGVTIDDCAFNNLWYGVKIGTGYQSSGLTFTNSKAVNNCQALFVACLSDSTFQNLDLGVDSTGTWGKNHVVYMNRDNHNLTFSNVTLTGGRGQALQLYMETQDTGDTSDNITFSGLTITTSYGPIVISQNYKGVKFTELKATGGPTASVIQAYGAAANVSVNGFTCSGGMALVGSSDATDATALTGDATGWVVSNGTYKGTTLVYGPDRFTPYPIGSGVTLVK